MDWTGRALVVSDRDIRQEHDVIENSYKHYLFLLQWKCWGCHIVRICGEVEKEIYQTMLRFKTIEFTGK